MTLNVKERKIWAHINTAGEHLICTGPGDLCSIVVNGGSPGFIKICAIRSNDPNDCDTIAMIDNALRGQTYEYHAVLTCGLKLVLNRDTDITVLYTQGT